MLILESGYLLKCIRINKKNVFGELTFNILNYGYIETISDPSYKSQFLVLSNSHIGNIGFIYQDSQFNKILLNTIIVNNYSIASNFRINEILFLFLKKKKIQILSNIDTRELISIIQTIGQQIVCTIFGNIIIIILYIRSISKFNMYYD